MVLDLSLTINQYIFFSLALVGFSFISYLLISAFKALIHRFKYGEYPTTPLEKELFSLKEENKRLKEKNIDLEDQITSIAKNLINKLQE